MKYTLGDTAYWIESGTNYQKRIPCPMCFGKLFVTVILGDDTQEKVECGFCQRGVERPSGYATTWEASATVHLGIITGVSTKDGIRYEVGYKSLFEHEIYSESEAELVRVAKFEEAKEQAEKLFRDSFITATKKQVWSAGYHRENIKRAERNIEWHKLRLGMIKTPHPEPKENE